jgi:flagellar hook assembly protein FlgD
MDTSVRLSIYDLKGRLVRKLKSEAQSAGHQEAFWNGLDEHQSPVSSGIYLAQLSTPGFSQSIKLVYIK